MKTLGGDILSDTEVWHVCTIANGLIERMDLKESDPRSHQTPSGAFPDLEHEGNGSRLFLSAVPALPDLPPAAREERISPCNFGISNVISVGAQA